MKKTALYLLTLTTIFSVVVSAQAADQRTCADLTTPLVVIDATKQAGLVNNDLRNFIFKDCPQGSMTPAQYGYCSEGIRLYEEQFPGSKFNFRTQSGTWVINPQATFDFNGGRVFRVHFDTGNMTYTVDLNNHIVVMKASAGSATYTYKPGDPCSPRLQALDAPNVVGASVVALNTARESYAIQQNRLVNLVNDYYYDHNVPYQIEGAGEKNSWLGDVPDPQPNFLDSLIQYVMFDQKFREKVFAWHTDGRPDTLKYPILKHRLDPSS